ncbi:MAG: transcription initiation factor IIB family protein [Thermoplasmata archaeon]|nr:transcription initiation factor IIB family protein [Thermoplasmata archaeon]
MCASPHRIRDEAIGEVHCADCGLVLSENELVTPIPAAREGGQADGSGRGIGPFVPRGTSGRRLLGSTLNGSRDGQGRRLGWQRRYEFQHLRRVMQRQTTRGADGMLERSQARGAIQQAANGLGLPPLVATEAERLIREATPRAILRGRSLPACVGAAVYAACRSYSIPRTLGEVARAVGARRSEVGRAFKVLHRGLGLAAPSVNSHAFLARYAEELALSQGVRSTVEEMLEVSQQDPELSGLPAHGLVAAMIYLAADRGGEHRSRAQVARVSAVTEVTLRSTGRILERLMGRHKVP